MASLNRHVGLFLLALATLMYEVLLTRIFSVTTWYHFAFLAISITLFGLSLGGILVYVKPKIFRVEDTDKHVALSALWFAGLSVLAILVHLYSPMIVAGADSQTVISVGLLCTLPFTLLAFTASGIGISLALTRYPAKVNSLYAADLLGAALGCIFVVLALRYVDAITGVLIAASMSCIAASLYARSDDRKVRTAVLASLVAFIGLGAWQAWSYVQQKPLIMVQWTKGIRQIGHNYELWNTFSRIRVFGDENARQQSDVYGLSNKHAENAIAQFLYLDIDGAAGTPIYKFNGDLAPLNFLQYEITNFAHHLRPNSSVLIIGAGGGKDILSALVMNQKHVTAVEINENIIKAVNDRYGYFGGRLIDHPKVTLVNDEARSYVSRIPDKFDIIQISMIDTWAATASGAYALSENGLYTRESFRALLNHLTDNGVLTVTRWYAKSLPAEFFRLTALAADTLRSLGVNDPQTHIMAFRNMPKMKNNMPDGIGTLLVCRSAFTPADVEKAKQWAKEMEFDIVYTPDGTTIDPAMAALASGADPATAAPSIPFNLKPPTDDNPFFFQTLSLRHLFSPEAQSVSMNTVNVLAALMLIASAFFTGGLLYFCVRIPYVLSSDKNAVRAAAPLFLYFFCIGAGFMFIEISQIERISIYLGHPVYGLSVVLFALLLSTGLGSLLSQRILERHTTKYPAILAIAVLIMLAYAALSPLVLTATESLPTLQRILTAVGVLFPVGIMLGTGFPLGMRMAIARNEALSPWLWGINGAASVFASVLAIVVAMFASITMSFLCGVVAYVVAGFAAWLLTKSAPVTAAQ
jgi:predicted membrane-bound spermidine synthase